MDTHHAPIFSYTPKAAHFAASCRFASSKTIFADFPPSSSVTDFRLDSAAAMAMRRPVIVEPVKAILSMSMCLERASPVVRPRPLTKLKTPAGYLQECTSVINLLNTSMCI